MSIVFVVSAPSGSGKSTLVGKLLERVPGLAFSVSYTTRAPRGRESQGEHYHYIGREEFEERARSGEFLEHAKVFENYYGTHRSVLDQARAQGLDLVLDIDVQGARQLRDKVEDVVTIFILAPSRQALEQRLRARSEDSEEVIERRLREAATEIRGCRDYDYLVVNREVESSVQVLKSIVLAERAKRCRLEQEIRPILATFEGLESS
jgi:guanylate kinase